MLHVFSAGFYSAAKINSFCVRQTPKMCIIGHLKLFKNLSFKNCFTVIFYAICFVPLAKGFLSPRKENFVKDSYKLNAVLANIGQVLWVSGQAKAEGPAPEAPGLGERPF